MALLASGELPERVAVADVLGMLAGALGVVEGHVQHRRNRLEHRGREDVEVHRHRQTHEDLLPEVKKVIREAPPAAKPSW